MLVWSLNCGLRGIFPSTDHLNKPFDPKSWRGRMAGRPLAGRWKMAFGEMRADNEFYALAYKWNHYRCSHICPRCFCLESGRMAWIF